MLHIWTDNVTLWVSVLGGLCEACVIHVISFQVIISTCIIKGMNGSLSWLHSSNEDAVSWLTSYGS